MTTKKKTTAKKKTRHAEPSALPKRLRAHFVLSVESEGGRGRPSIIAHADASLGLPRGAVTRDLLLQLLPILASRFGASPVGFPAAPPPAAAPWPTPPPSMPLDVGDRVRVLRSLHSPERVGNVGQIDQLGEDGARVVFGFGEFTWSLLADLERVADGPVPAT